MVPLVFKTDPAVTTYKSFKECYDGSLSTAIAGTTKTPDNQNWDST